MSDHTPVLFNMFEDWNQESLVLHISFVLNARFDSRFDSNADPYKKIASSAQHCWFCYQDWHILQSSGAVDGATRLLYASV